MSPLTAKTHVSRAMTKLGLRDRAQLVVFAYETGLRQGVVPLASRGEDSAGERAVRTVDPMIELTN